MQSTRLSFFAFLKYKNFTELFGTILTFASQLRLQKGKERRFSHTE